MLKLKNLLFTENIKDIAKAKKIKKRVQKSESRLRLNMYELADRMSADIPNKKLADQLIKSYQKNYLEYMYSTNPKATVVKVTNGLINI